MCLENNTIPRRHHYNILTLNIYIQRAGKQDQNTLRLTNVSKTNPIKTWSLWCCGKIPRADHNTKDVAC